MGHVARLMSLKYRKNDFSTLLILWQPTGDAMKLPSLGGSPNKCDSARGVFTTKEQSRGQRRQLLPDRQG